MENKTKRMVLYISDMRRLTGRSERTVRRWVAAIKKTKNIKLNRLITVAEFCEYTGYDPGEVKEFLE